MSQTNEQPPLMKITSRTNKHLIRLAVLNIKHRLQREGCENLYTALLQACPYKRDYLNEWQHAINSVLDLTNENVDKLKLADWNSGLPILIEDTYLPLWDGTPITPAHIEARKRRR